jgi:purine nucleosidase
VKRLLIVLACILPFLNAPAAEAAQYPGAPVVIFDSDMDYDDAATLAYLAQEHRLGRIELRAVTVVNNGAGLPGRGIKHARCLLQRFGLDRKVLVADGSNSAPNAFPDEIKTTIDKVVSDAVAGCSAPETPSQVPAPALLRQLLAREPSAQVIATGPLTNLAAALPRAAGRVTIMGGAIHVPGNLCCGTPATFDGTQEFNFWIDPPSSRKVIRSTPAPVRLVPLDATKEVPITQAFIERLHDDRHTPAAQVVYDIASHPAIAQLIADGLMFWWDPLAAMTLIHSDVVDFSRERLDVVTDGPSAGRTLPYSRGAVTTVGTAGHTAVFEQRFIDTLNGRF